jgi:hypothetical protein
MDGKIGVMGACKRGQHLFNNGGHVRVDNQQYPKLPKAIGGVMRKE